MGISCRPPSSRRRFRRVNTRLGGMAFLILALAMTVFLPPAVSRAKEQKSSLIAKIRNLKDQLTNSVVQVKHLIPAPSAPWHPVTVVPDAFHLEWTTSGQWHFQNYSAPLLRTKAGESAMISLYTHCTPVRPAPVGGKPTVLEAYKPIWSCKVYYSETNPALPNAPEGVLAVLGTDYTWERLCTPTWIFDPQVPSFSTDEVFQFTPLKAGYWQVCPTLASVQKIKPATNVTVGDPVTVDQSEDGLPVVIGCTLDLVVTDPVKGEMAEEPDPMPNPPIEHETTPGAVTNCYSDGIPVQLKFEPADYPGDLRLSSNGRSDIKLSAGSLKYDLNNYLPVGGMVNRNDLNLIGVGPDISSLNLTFYLYLNETSFLSDSATISFDDLDMEIDGVIDPRYKALLPNTDPDKTKPDEENPGVFISLNIGQDPEMKPVKLQWLRSKNKITCGQVKFSGVDGTPSTYNSETKTFEAIPGATAVQGCYRMWMYSGTDANNKKMLTAIPPDTWVTIPQDTPDPAFYVEAIVDGTKTDITATYKPNPNMPSLTFADSATVVTPRFKILQVPQYLFASAKYWTPIKFQIEPNSVVVSYDQITNLTAKLVYSTDAAGAKTISSLENYIALVKDANGNPVPNTFECYINPTEYDGIEIANGHFSEFPEFKIEATVTKDETSFAVNNYSLNGNGLMTRFVDKCYFAVDIEEENIQRTLRRKDFENAFIFSPATRKYQSVSYASLSNPTWTNTVTGVGCHTEPVKKADGTTINVDCWNFPTLPKVHMEGVACSGQCGTSWSFDQEMFDAADLVTNESENNNDGHYSAKVYLKQYMGDNKKNIGVGRGNNMGTRFGAYFFISYGGKEVELAGHTPQTPKLLPGIEMPYRGLDQDGAVSNKVIVKGKNDGGLAMDLTKDKAYIGMNAGNGTGEASYTPPGSGGVISHPLIGCGLNCGWAIAGSLAAIEAIAAPAAIAAAIFGVAASTYPYLATSDPTAMAGDARVDVWLLATNEAHPKDTSFIQTAPNNILSSKHVVANSNIQDCNIQQDTNLDYRSVGTAIIGFVELDATAQMTAENTSGNATGYFTRAEANYDMSSESVKSRETDGTITIADECTRKRMLYKCCRSSAIPQSAGN
jgi:hypothetical protein